MNSSGKKESQGDLSYENESLFNEKQSLGKVIRR
jgi:hypothetical protein